jgi:two-component system phosphate regulon sensor histidine kinase PhoR
MTFERSLLDHLPNAIAVITESGAIEYRNDAFEETFGSDAAHWMKEAARAVAGERGWLHGFFVESEDLRTIDVEIEGRVYRIDRILRMTGGEAPAVALAFEDVTREREAEQAKSDFTAQIVHDLRGPLSGIQGTLEFVLSAETKLDTIYTDLLQEAQRESERMMNLINEILDFSKIRSGNFTVEQEPIRVAGVLKRAVRSLQSVAARDEVFLLSAHGRDVPQIIGSVEKLTQAVINLISNSLKFTPQKGLISVGAQIMRNDQDHAESIVITVTDSGMGIKADELQTIFEKYKQSGTKSLRGGGGTGLGLYIVKQVVEAHGGDVSVASVEGVGTSMVLRLPVKRAA